MVYIKFSDLDHFEPLPSSKLSGTFAIRRHINQTPFSMWRSVSATSGIDIREGSSEKECSSDSRANIKWSLRLYGGILILDLMGRGRERERSQRERERDVEKDGERDGEDEIEREGER